LVRLLLSRPPVVLTALIAVPVVPPLGGPTARLWRAGRGPRNGTDLPAVQLPTSHVLGGELLHSLENNSLRPTPRFKTCNTIPPGAIRAARGIPRGDHNRCRLSISARRGSLPLFGAGLCLCSARVSASVRRGSLPPTSASARVSDPAETADRRSPKPSSVTASNRAHPACSPVVLAFPRTV
jgi:hypothetical protein